MKTGLLIVLILSLISNAAFADKVVCNWKQVKHNPDHTYLYTEPLHLCVGQLVSNQDFDLQEIDDLKKALDLKALALDDADRRAVLWEKTSQELDIKVNQIKEEERRGSWIYFGLGFIAASALMYSASRMNH